MAGKDDVMFYKLISDIVFLLFLYVILKPFK